MEFRLAVNGIGILWLRSFDIEMFVATALFMAAVHDFENVVTAVSDVSCNIVQLHYAVFFLGGRRPLSRSHDMYGRFL